MVVLGIFQAFAVIQGVVLGSFLNVCIVRLPEDRSVVAPRSACPYCRTQLTAGELIPVLSYVVQRGRCRTCGSPISPSYPLVELLTGLLAWLLFRRLINDPSDLDLAHGLAFVVFLVFLCLLLVATFVDVRHWIIPDETSVYAIPVGVLGAAALGWVGYDDWLALNWKVSAAGALVGGSAMAAASIIARWVLGREALGWGDVKLMAMIGAFTGPIQVIFLVLLPASILGSIVGLVHLAWTRRRSYLPYGPSLAAGAALYVFYGDVVAARWFPGVGVLIGMVNP